MAVATVPWVSGERIVLIEDDNRIGASLQRALASSGYRVRWEPDGQRGLTAVAEHDPTLVILDLGLPDIDGLDVCRHIHRTHPAVEVIMLTARDEEIDIVVGLDAGAVDYITKPFRLAELLARVRAQSRRVASTLTELITINELTVDPAARRVFVDGCELELRPKEFDLLARLVTDAGHSVTRDTLMADVWDSHWHGSTKTLDFHIAALRRHLDTPGHPSRITTVRGVGFRYETS